jgi:hypothetical protein
MQLEALAGRQYAVAAFDRMVIEVSIANTPSGYWWLFPALGPTPPILGKVQWLFGRPPPQSSLQAHSTLQHRPASFASFREQRAVRGPVPIVQALHSVLTPTQLADLLLSITTWAVNLCCKNTLWIAVAFGG